MLTIEDVARWTRNDVSYELGLVSAVLKGHRARRTRSNPYRMEIYQKAWQLGFDNKHESREAVRQGWLNIRKQYAERLYGQPKVQPATAAEAPQLTVFNEDDFRLQSFEWKLIPPKSSFWGYWHTDKERMRAAGYRVIKDDCDGRWFVCKDAVTAQPTSEPNHASAQIIPFPVSRIVRHIRNGQPVTDSSNAAA